MAGHRGSEKNKGNLLFGVVRFLYQQRKGKAMSEPRDYQAENRSWFEEYMQSDEFLKTLIPTLYTAEEREAMGAPTYVSPEGFITWE